MLITMYRAAKIAGKTPMGISKKKNNIPRPGYFVDISDKGSKQKKYMVDDQHPEWIQYLKNIELQKTIAGNDKKSIENKLFTAVYDVLTASLDMPKEDILTLLNKIEKRYDK